MTEFLIFLGLCAVFSFLFWRFLRLPSREQRIKAQSKEEIGELYAQAAAEQANEQPAPAAPKANFGRKGRPAEPDKDAIDLGGSSSFEDNTTTADSHTIQSSIESFRPALLEIERHKTGLPEEEPFGEDISTPASRDIPDRFWGVWAWEKSDNYPIDDPRHTETFVIEIDRVIEGGQNEPVVAVRAISPQDPSQYDLEIAVVTQAVDPDDNKWDYSLRYFGVSPDGERMTNLESMDMVYVRKLPAKR